MNFVIDVPPYKSLPYPVFTPGLLLLTFDQKLKSVKISTLAEKRRAYTDELPT